MLSNYHTLHYVVSTIASVFGGKPISGVISQEKGEAVLTSRGTETALVISCRSDTNTLYFQARFSRAKANSANILESAWNNTIVSASVLGSDRIARLQLDSGSSIYVQFFGARANVILADSGGTITDSFKNARKLIGSHFEEPDPHPPDYDPGTMEERIRSEGVNLGLAFKKVYPTLGLPLIREILYRADVGHDVIPANVDRDRFGILRTAFREVLEDLQHPRPRIYSSETSADPEMFSLIPLKHLGNRSVRPFDDVSDGIRTFIHTRRSVETEHNTRETIITAVEKKIERAARTCSAIQDDLRNSTRADDYQFLGTLLLSHLQDVPRGSSLWTFQDESGIREVRLDPRRSPAQNAQRYFDKAKQSRSVQAQVHERLSTLEATIAMGTGLLSSLAQITTREALKAFMNERSEELHAFGITGGGKKEELPPFRIFTVDGGFQVLAGKSSANNDLLTMKYAKQNDLWFHARGSSGSHVVLRVGSGSGPPSKRAKAQAAGIAAYYSKMRNAKTVPVAMTERKYVHKPKGAPAGTVVLDRETVIFADPALPQDP